jgi:hypothetical protein
VLERGKRRNHEKIESCGYDIILTRYYNLIEHYYNLIESNRELLQSNTVDIISHSIVHLSVVNSFFIILLNDFYRYLKGIPMESTSSSLVSRFSSFGTVSDVYNTKSNTAFMTLNTTLSELR